MISLFIEDLFFNIDIMRLCQSKIVDTEIYFLAVNNYNVVAGGEGGGCVK